MAEQLGERTEQPTGKRLSDARNRGQIAKSTDLSSAVDLIGALVLLVVLGGYLVGGLTAILRGLLDARGAGATLGVDSAVELLAWAGLETARILAPFFLLMLVVAYIAQFIQVGWLLTLEPLRPNPSRLSPLKGIKRLLGPRSLVKTAVGVVKLTAITAVVVLVVRAKFAQIGALPMLDTLPAFILIGRMIAEVAVWILALLLAIGLIDLAYQRWQHTRDMRMTKQEVKEERRSMEGDLELKARRIRMGRQMIMQRMRQAVPTADVVVTNPTHFSVAIRYDPDTMSAPQVVAKGADFMAFRIREIAAAHRVPIVEKPPLARALFASAEVGQQISPEFYEAVAEVLAYVYRLGDKAA